MWEVKDNLPPDFTFTDDILNLIAKELVKTGAVYHAKSNSLCNDKIPN